MRAFKKALKTGLTVFNAKVGSGYQSNAAQDVVHFTHICVERLKQRGFRIIEPSADVKVSSLHSKIFHVLEEERFCSAEAKNSRSQPFKVLSLQADKTAYFKDNACVSKITVGQRGEVRETWSNPPQGKNVMIEEDLNVLMEDKDDSPLSPEPAVLAGTK